MSWGSATPEYTYTARELDEFMYRNDDYLIVVAAGNAGSPNRAFTVGSPATAKNVLSVGASLNSLAGWRRAALGPDDIWRYRHGILDPAHVNGQTHMYNEEWLADFSSRGPTADNRTKPDIVAPGRMILSSRSGGRNTSELLLMQGTSMATPLVVRSMVVLRHVLQHRYKVKKPSSALMHALVKTSALHLQNGVAMLAFRAGSKYARNFEVKASLDKYDEGWGRVFLGPFLSDQIGWKDRESIRGFQSSHNAYCFKAVQTGEARMTLVWTDPPGPLDGMYDGKIHRALVNDLDLRVMDWEREEERHMKHDPSRVVLGNHGYLPDRRNPTERVAFHVREGSIVRVVVSALGPMIHPAEHGMHWSLHGAQNYALAWTKSKLSEVACSHECTPWDQELECLDGDGRRGVRRCEPLQMKWSAECYIVIDRDNREVCEKGGYAMDSSGACVCYGNVPCTNDTSDSYDGGGAVFSAPSALDEYHHFRVCDGEGEHSQCTKIGGVYAAVPDVSYATVFAMDGPSPSSSGLSAGDIVAIVVGSVAGSLLLSLFAYRIYDRHNVQRMASTMRDREQTASLRRLISAKTDKPQPKEE